MYSIFLSKSNNTAPSQGFLYRQLGDDHSKNLDYIADRVYLINLLLLQYGKILQYRTISHITYSLGNYLCISQPLSLTPTQSLFSSHFDDSNIWACVIKITLHHTTFSLSINAFERQYISFASLHLVKISRRRRRIALCNFSIYILLGPWDIIDLLYDANDLLTLLYATSKGFSSKWATGGTNMWYKIYLF